MCGVAGIFAYNGAAPPVDHEELRAIRDHMAARGPDGQGEWYSNDHRVGLAHRRLSIIDLSDRAAQPMTRAEGRLVISFNGEIYNYPALRQRLEGKGYRFRTESDTEVLLALYAAKGEAMLEDLRGMFAFVIWDTAHQLLFLARDSYGIKPLYYADDGKTFRCASQVKALLAGGAVPDDLDPAGAVGFHLFGTLPEPCTSYRAVRALPAGCSMQVTEKGADAPRRWFSIARVFCDAEAALEPAGSDLQQEVRSALLDSVQHHLVADVPVGLFLSSGIDSGALTGLAAMLRRQAGDGSPLRSVTLAFEEFRGSAGDETPLAAEIARRYGVEHHVRVVGEPEFRQDLPAILAAMDQPSIDGVNTWFISKAARELGLKVAISGLGGDELFGGYPSFHDIPSWVRMFRLPSRFPGLGRGVRTIGEGLRCLGLSMHSKMSGMLEYGGSYPGAYLLRRGLFMPWELPEVLGEDLAREGLRGLDPLGHIGERLNPEPYGDFAKVAVLESTLYMRNQLLRDADWAGMAHSLEIRVPLVDFFLLRRLAPMLTDSQETSGKSLLAEAPEPALPKVVADRAKTGFTTPVSSWQQRLPLARNVSVPDGERESAWARRWARVVWKAQIEDPSAL